MPEINHQKWFRYNLNKPYRCPPAIQNLSDCYAGFCGLDLPLVQEASHEKTIGVVGSSEQKLLSDIENEIESFIEGGLKPNDIVIISVRGKGEEKNIMHRKNIGSRRIVPATDVDADSEIFCDTFLRFKGLQRPAVIVTDLRLVSSFYEKRMHMAISRTQSFLRIVGGESGINNDKTLSKFIQKYFIWLKNMPNGESKNWVRFCVAINGFRAHYNSQPNRVRVPEYFIKELHTVLSFDSFKKLNPKVVLIGDGSPYIAEDGAGRSYNYGSKGFSKIKPDVRSSEWLGIEPDYYDQNLEQKLL